MLLDLKGCIYSASMVHYFPAVFSVFLVVVPFEDMGQEQKAQAAAKT